MRLPFKIASVYAGLTLAMFTLSGGFSSLFYRAEPLARPSSGLSFVYPGDTNMISVDPLSTLFVSFLVAGIFVMLALLVVWLLPLREHSR